MKEDFIESKNEGRINVEIYLLKDEKIKRKS